MGIVVTLLGFTPLPRQPPAWTQARIEEAVTADGPFTPIETIALDLDADPLHPAARDLTTTEATLEAGWYRVTWLDAGGNTHTTQPVFSPASEAAPQPLIDIEDLRRAVNVGDSFAIERLPQIVAGVENWVLGETRRQLRPLPDPHVHRVRVNGSRFIRVPDAREITLVTIDGVEVTDYELHRHPFPADGPVTHVEVFMRGRVAEVTGQFGFIELPNELREAMLAHMAHLVYQERAGFVASQVTEWGSREYAATVPPWPRLVYTNYKVPDDLIGY